MEGWNKARNEKSAAKVPSVLFAAGAAVLLVRKSGKLAQYHAIEGTGG